MYFLYIVEVIQTTDPDFNQSGMFSGGGEISANTAGQRTSAAGSGGGHRRNGAYIKILEQPASKALRYLSKSITLNFTTKKSTRLILKNDLEYQFLL